MSTENTPVENPIPGLPRLPDPDPATKAEAEAKAKAAAQEGKDEVHADPKAKADPKEETPPAPKHEPVTQEDVDKAVKEAQEKAKAEWSGDYVSLDHEAGQAVVNMLKAAEVSPTEANKFFEKAIQSGNLADIDWTGLEGKIGKDQLVLAKAGIQSYYNDVYSVRQQEVEAVYKEYGGQKNWETVRDWAQTKEKSDKVFAKQVSEFRKAINTGGWAAQAAARELKSLYEADPNTKGFDNANLHHGSERPEPVGGPLSKSEYFELRKKADAEGAPEDVINSLMARRKAGKARGI